MRPRLGVAVMVVSIAGSLALGWAVLPCPIVHAQEGAVVDVWLDLVNEVRLDEGLDPYAQSRLLTRAAQRHADDLAQNGLANADDAHRGSDGTDEQERVEEAGYAAWTEDGDQLVVGEVVWIGDGTPQQALGSWLDAPESREDLLSEAFREIGIGAATDSDGGRVYVLDFGARANVLPIFVNDGAARTTNREVAVRLTNERVRPEGEGAVFIGEAMEIRLSNDPAFDDLPWQSWAPLVSWILPDVAGEHTVYVEFRDAGGRTTASADAIVLDVGTPSTVTEEPLTPAPTPLPSAVAASPTGTPEITTGEEPTTPPSPTEPAVSQQGETATDRSPTATSPYPVVSRATPFPTWTPLPSRTPAPAGPIESDQVSLSLPELGRYGRPLTAVGVMQAVVIVLGVYLVLRRSGRG